MNYNIENLEEQLQIEKDIYKRIDIMSIIAWELRRKDSMKSFNIARKAYDLSSEVEYKKGLAESFLCLSVYDSFIGNFSESLEKSLKAFNMFEELDNEDGKIKALNSLGYTYNILGKNDIAIEYYIKGLSIAKQTDNYDMIIVLLNNIGELYKGCMNMYEEALKYYFEAYDYCKKVNNQFYGFLLNSIGDTYLCINNTEKALEYCEIALGNSTANNDVITQAQCYKTLGKIYSCLNIHDKALNCFNYSLTLHMQTDNTYGQSTVLTELGAFYIQNEDYNSAIHYLEAAQKLAQGIAASQTLANVHLKLAQVYEKTNDFVKSSDHYKNYIRIKDEIVSIDLEKKLNALIIESRIKQAEKDMEIYKLKNVELNEKSEEIELKAKQLEESYKNIEIISKIGQKITASLDIETILNTIYENINILMDATIFGIGLYNQKNNTIDYRMFIENFKRIPGFVSELDIEKSFASKCIIEKKEVIINDFIPDYSDIEYIPDDSPDVDETPPRSLIYYPLFIEDKAIGTITVQSYKPNAYSQYNIDTLKALASYIGIALNNSHKSEKLKNTADELQVTLKNLQETQEYLINSEKMVALGQLISGIAHEINTPLGAIQASLSNISEYIEHTISKSIPEIFKMLNSELQQLFLDMLHDSMTKDITIPSRDERQFKRKLSIELQNLSIDNYDSMADTLVDMGLYDKVDKYVPLFKHKESQYIIQTCYEMSGIVRNIKNMNLAIGKASKMVYALKSYSHYDQIDKPIEVDITQGIDTVLALYHNNIKHGIELIKNYRKIPKVSCLPDELNQVWTNLIYNALQAMNYSGVLEIETEHLGDYVEVRITDNGIGIPDDIKSKIFEPFFTTKKQGEGSGLGLGIVKKIINKHNGEITFESVPGRTCFTVKLPVNSFS